ncbi:hypothetical protein [Nonomuraea rosea]
MEILSSLLPGVRALRAPLFAGVLWLGVAVIILAPYRDKLLATSEAGLAIKELTSGWPDGFTIPAILFLSYLLGNVATGILSPLVKLVGNAINKVLAWAASKENRPATRPDGTFQLKARRPYRLFRVIRGVEFSARPMSILARSLTIDAIANSLHKAGVPGMATYIFPIEAGIRDLRHSAAQLSQSASPQYQEFDRIQAESELRLAIAPPIVTLGIIFPLNGSIWLVCATLLIATVLLIQALIHHRRTVEILATSAYLGFTVIPLVQSVADRLSQLKEPPQSEGGWMGAIVVALHQGNHLEEEEESLRELAEFNEDDRADARSYLEQHDLEAAGSFDRLMEKRVPPPWEREEAESPTEVPLGEQR